MAVETEKLTDSSQVVRKGKLSARCLAVVLDILSVALRDFVMVLQLVALRERDLAATWAVGKVSQVVATKGNVRVEKMVEMMVDELVA